MIQSFSIWLAVPAEGLRTQALDHLLSDTLGGRPLRWAVTACQPERWLVEGAVIR